MTTLRPFRPFVTLPAALALSIGLAAIAWSQPRVDFQVLAGPPAACGVWSYVLPPEEPFAAHDFAPVYDAVRNRVVLFGGRGSDGSLRRDVLQLDLNVGGGWSVLATTGVPPTARAEHGAFLDPARDRMIVFGGYDGTVRNDVWALDLESLAWSQLATTGPKPPARRNHVAAHDLLRDRMLVVGGVGGFAVNADAYALTLETLVWETIPAPGPNPGIRQGHTAVYDAVRDRVVVYGGIGVGDLFALDLAAPAWTELSPAGTPPVARSEHVAVMDLLGDRMLVFGGELSSGITNEPWSLQFSPTLEWVPLATSGVLPAPRRSHAALLESGSMLVLGAAGEVADETWRLALGPSPAWTELVPAGKPMRERESHTAVWDSQSSGMWIWGGRSGTTSWEGDLWFVDPLAPAWTHVATPGNAPAARDEHAAIFDATRQRMVLFGGRSGASVHDDVWALDLAGTPAWSPLGSPGPSARFDHAAVYDPVRERMLVLAGTNGVSNSNDVWALSLETGVWTPLVPAGAPPPARYGHVAVFDPVRDRVVIVGGTDGASLFSDVWALDLAGTPTWSELAPDGGPLPGLAGHAGAYDPVADRVVLFGGTTSTGRTQAAWALVFGPTLAWQPLLADLFVPQARANHAVVWDGTSNRFLIAGGFSPVQRTNDVAALSGTGLVSLVLGASPSNAGAISRIPSKNCFGPNTNVQITAVPAAGFGFAGWSGDAGGTQNPLVLTMNSAKNVVATFTGYTVTVAVDPLGTGFVTRAPDRATYAPGEQVTLNATALDGGAFSHWSGDASGSTNPLTVTVNDSLTIVANFIGYPVVTDVSPPAGGVVQRIPDTPVYPPGAQIQLLAIPVGGRGFSHWSGDTSGSANPLTLIVEGPLNVIANFVGYPLVTEVLPLGGGAVERTPDTQLYAPGLQVQLRAVPGNDNDFSHWSGDASGSETPILVTMDGPKTVTANFAVGIHTLDVTIQPPLAGTVVRDPPATKYIPGRIVTLTAVPVAGQYAFTGWTGDTTATANPLAIAMTGNRSLTANFVGYSLVTQVTPAGSGNILRNPNHSVFAPGTAVTLTAVPAPGQTFVDWSGDVSGSANPVILTMDGPKTVTARFISFPLVLSVNPPGAGTITKTPNQEFFAIGDTVTLTAVPIPERFGFSHWSGDVTGPQNPVTIVIDGLKTITAHFTGYPLTVVADPPELGTVTVDPDLSTYAPGSTVTLTAESNTLPFSGWSGDASGFENPLTLTMDGPKSITATFLGLRLNITTAPPDPRLYVVRYPDLSGYAPGTVVLLEAPTHLGYDFLNWSGDATGTENPIFIQMSGDLYITAHFGGFPLLFGIEPPAGGSVFISPSKPLYAPGRTVTVTAVPAPGLEFTGWTGDVTGPNPLVLTMPAETLHVVAHFAAALPRCLEWQPVFPPNSPGPRTRHALAFDSGRQRMILFGGLSATFDRNNDVWVKPLSDDSGWVEIQVQGDPPEARHSASAIHDPVRNRLIVFGGRTPFGVRNDAWALNLDGVPTWTQLAPTGALPLTRFGAAAVYDPAGDQMVLFGGNSTVSSHNDTWALALAGGPAWTQLNPQNPPPGRYYASTVYDPARNRMIIAGGRATAAGSQFDDAWFLSLSPFGDWTHLKPAGYAPDARAAAAAAFDPVRDRIVLSGGETANGVLDDVVELSLVGRTAWNRPQVSTAFRPSARSNATMVYDAAADRVLLYGGQEADGDILGDLVELSFAQGLSLNVVVDPPGTGTYTISPADPCITPGTPVTLQAFAEPGFRFLTWENLGTAENPLTMIASNHVSVVARFGPIATDVAPAQLDFGIRGVFPNPSRGAIRIDYTLPSDARVRLTVLDVSGRVVANPIEGMRAAGAHSETWDGRMGGTLAPEGIYFLRLAAGHRFSFRRVALLR